MWKTVKRNQQIIYQYRNSTPIPVSNVRVLTALRNPPSLDGIVHPTFYCGILGRYSNPILHEAANALLVVKFPR